MGTNQNEAMSREKANELAKKALESMTPGALYAFQIVARNLKNGVFWGFTDIASVKQHADDIKSDKNIKARKISDRDCIIEVQPDYVMKNIVSVAPDAFSRQDLAKMQDNMGKAVVEFEKFLVNKGISQQGFSSTIGIYCTNNVTMIAHKGVSFPAFRLNMEMTLNILAECGYYVKVNGSFISASEAMKRGQELWNSTMLSPTKTGVFINIKSGYSAAMLKELKKNLDARYKSK